MPSAPVFNLDALLAPIAGENPSGENLQYSGLHDEIREARRADDDVAQGDWVRELKVADWEKVAELAGESLSGKTKDLQIVAWLSEAAVNMNGFPGLRDSLKLANGLLETFWDTLYPEIDEGNDLEARANALAWMDRQAAEAARKVPLTKRAGANYSFFQWEEALQYDFPADTSKLSSEALKQLEEKRARAQADGKITGEEIRKAKSETRRAFYEEVYSDVTESWAALKALDKADGRALRAPDSGARQPHEDSRRSPDAAREGRQGEEDRGAGPVRRRGRGRGRNSGRRRGRAGRVHPGAGPGARPARAGRRLLPEDRAAQPGLVPRPARHRVGADAARRLARRRDQGQQRSRRSARNSRSQGRVRQRELEGGNHAEEGKYPAETEEDSPSPRSDHVRRGDRRGHRDEGAAVRRRSPRRLLRPARRAAPEAERPEADRDRPRQLRSRCSRRRRRAWPFASTTSCPTTAAR